MARKLDQKSTLANYISMDFDHRVPNFWTRLPKTPKNLSRGRYILRFKVFHVARLIHICAFYTSHTFSTRWKEMLKFIQSFYTLMYIPPDIHNIMICLELNISYMKSYPRSQGQRRNHDLLSWTTTMISEQIARWLLVAKKNIGSSSLSLKRW